MATKKRPFTVSDHALVRWLSRVQGIDMEWMREALAHQIEDRVAPGMSKLIMDGIEYRFANGCLTTVVPKEDDSILGSRYSEA